MISSYTKREAKFCVIYKLLKKSCRQTERQTVRQNNKFHTSHDTWSIRHFIIHGGVRKLNHWMLLATNLTDRENVQLHSRLLKHAIFH